MSFKRIFDKNSDELVCSARKFLRDFGTVRIMGRKWADLFSTKAPEDRFDAIIAACGHENDPVGFFLDIRDFIQNRPDRGISCNTGADGVAVNGVVLPTFFLYHLLEPAETTRKRANRLLSIKTVERLEEETGIRSGEPSIMQQVLDQYPVRLSDHVIRQSMVSQAVAAQYLPYEGELDPRGHTLTFDGHFKNGPLEQMYRNRAIFLLDMRCPVYCRFCFRKHKNLRQEKTPSPAEIKEAVAGIRKKEDIKEILITGGEPLLNRRNLSAALEGLMEIDHIKTLRIATRSLAYYPRLFLNHNREYLRYLKAMQSACRTRGKLIEIGVHFVHPDEVSIQSLEIISDLVSSGIGVYVQTPFLNKLNNEGRVLEQLFTLLRNAGAQIYYIFTPCHPIHGTEPYWSPISQAIEAHNHLRAHISDRAIPKLCTATPLGKMEWHTSGWAVDRDRSDPDHTWIRTPYTRDYFKGVTGTDTLPHSVRENNDKTLDVKCLVEMGDGGLFLGSHSLAPSIVFGPVNESFRQFRMKNRQYMEKETGSIFFSNSPLMPSMIPGPSQKLLRLHKTRAELNPGAGGHELAYLMQQKAITDIVLCLPMEEGISLDDQLFWAEQMVKKLKSLDHIACVRIRWQAFQENPELVSLGHLDQVAGLACFDIASFLKVELETWWIHPRQITASLGLLCQKLHDRGIQVYGNMALISGVNDDPRVIADMAESLRRAGIEFHHVYAAGLSIQDKFNGPCPISTDKVLAIASHVRKVCSGRQVPLYMIHTPLGEVDFGLTSRLFKAPGKQVRAATRNNGRGGWLVRLYPYDNNYFFEIDPGFSLDIPGVVREDDKIWMELSGLVREGKFPL